MQTVFTHNNAVDHVLIVDGNDDKVVSAWRVDRTVVEAYLADGAQAHMWEVGDGVDDKLSIADYGVEVGRNGELSGERREFYRL